MTVTSSCMMETITDVLQYSVEDEVALIWKEQPGIGVTDLLEALHEKFPPAEYGTVTKKRVKTAKQAVPFVQLLDLELELDVDLVLDPVLDPVLDNVTNAINAANGTTTPVVDCHFVQEQMEQRNSYRSVRQYAAADRIERGLTAMGIVIDDQKRTWHLVAPPSTTPTDEAVVMEETIIGISNGVKCDMCGRLFGSRNIVFAHLRDPSSGCGTLIFQKGETLPAPPSVEQYRVKQKSKQPRTANTGRTVQHTGADKCLWVGDLPVAWTRVGGKYKHLRALLFAHNVRGVPTPWIQNVIRKAYRDANGRYRGCATVVFRDEAEAQLVLQHLNGRQVSTESVYHLDQLIKEKDGALRDEPPFALKVRTVECGDADTSCMASATKDTPPGLDPPLSLQLQPLDHKVLHSRINHLRSQLSDEQRVNVETDTTGQERLCELASCYYEAIGQRPQVKSKGKAVPKIMLKPLMGLLKNLRWPARNERQGLSAERYLVLPTNTASKDIHYTELRQVCRVLMEWVDDDYYYSGIAVTKNFVASPHIDDRDQSFQYAISFGDFTAGGELCVEGIAEDDGSDFVNVVETRNRIARVDGRHPHWVRTWSGGDRYSLIFYDTSDRKPTPLVPNGVLA